MSVVQKMRLIGCQNVSNVDKQEGDKWRESVLVYVCGGGVMTPQMFLAEENWADSWCVITKLTERHSPTAVLCAMKCRAAHEQCVASGAPICVRTGALVFPHSETCIP